MPYEFGGAWAGNWQDCGLLKPSAIKPVLATLEQNLILRSLGALGASGQDSLHKAIAEGLG